MATCSHKAPNGEKSLLFQNLSQVYGPAIAAQLWDAVRTQQFLNKWGDWLNMQSTSIDASAMVNHSGGAVGSDTEWDKIGRSFGVNQHNHYWHGTKTPTGNVEITEEQLEEGWQHVKEANKTLKRKPDKYKSLLSRNWFQVSNADAIYAIGKLATPSTVSGGTGWAVQMAIDSRKPVHVFDQEQKDWMRFDYNRWIFVRESTPTLTPNFAGIGTREITPVGKLAIKEVYQKTFKAAENTVPLDVNGEPTYEFVKAALELQEPAVSTPKTEVPYNALDPEKRSPVRMSEEAMDERIRTLYEEAMANPDNIYILPHRNMGEKRTYNSGFTSREMANMFDKYPIPPNIKFDPGFATLIQNSSRRIIQELGSNLPVELMNRGDETINEHMLNILTPKTTADGKVVGYFTPGEQQDIIGSIIHFTQSILRQDPEAKANALIKAIYVMYQKAKQIDLQGGDTKLRDNLMYVYEQRVRFAEATLQQMEGLGLHTDGKTKAKILRAIESLRPMNETEKKLLEEKSPESLSNMFDETTGEFIEDAGRGLKDWGDISFELDPKDTASARMKMFIATLPDMDRGVYRTLLNEEGADVVIDPATVQVKDKTLAQILTNTNKQQAILNWNQQDPAGFQKMVYNLNRRNIWIQDADTTMALINHLNQYYPLVAKENILGMPRLVDYEATFSDILETLADTKQNLQAYMDTLKNSGKPNMQYLAQELQKADPSVQKEFAKVMSKQYQQFTMMLFNRTTDKDGRESMVLNPINANRYNQKNSIIKNWQQLQKLSDIMIINQAGDRVIDIARIQEQWIPVLEILNKVLDWNPTQIAWATNQLHGIFNASGVNMSYEMVEYLMNNMEKITKGQKFPGGLARQFSITKEGKPNGMFSAFILKAAGVTMVEDGEDMTQEENLNRAELHNPLYTEKSTMQILAGVAARFTPILHSTNHKSSEGKNIWDYGLNTKLSHKFRDFLTNFDQFKATADKIDFARGNWLIESITNNPALLANMRLSYLDGMKPTWSKRGTTRQSMSDREQMLMSIALFQNQGQGFNKVPRVNYLSLTHSDKTTTPLFNSMPRLNTGPASTMATSIIGTTKSAMYNIFRAEHQRIVNQKGVDFNNARYNKGKSLFYMIPDFNYDAMKQLVAEGYITDRELRTIWLNDTRELTQHINSDKELVVINKILNRFANNLIEDTITEWKNNGIIDAEKFTTLFDKKYIQKVLYQNGITTGRIGENQIYKDNTGNILEEEQVWNTLVTTAAKDYALNHFMFNSSLSQLFYGDPAQTYKGKDGTTDTQKVDATMKEYAKRLAKDIAPGQDLYWEDHQKKYTTITIADVKTSEDYLREFENLRAAYASVKNGDTGGPVEGTDAQEITTVQEHLDTLYAGGLITSKIYNEMSKIVKDAKGGYYEFTIPEHQAIIMQPQKPVYSGTREVFNGAQLEDYIKSSSYPLYPPMTTGTEMDKLRLLMENPAAPIQRANFESAKKIGLPNNPVVLFDKAGKFIQPKGNELQGATQVLDRSGFRIQQEVPYDEEKEAIKTVTQENKLITEGITDVMTEFRVGDRMMSGSQVREYKEAIRSAMMDINRKSFLDEMSVDRNAAEDGSWEINDKGKVYDILAEEARKKGYTMNELQSLLIRDASNELEIPLVFNTAADRLENMFMSMIRGIAEVKMPGKSFVQAASVGFTFTREEGIDKSKVVWLDTYDGTALKTLRRENGEVKAAQVLLPFNFFAADGTRLKVEDYMVVDEKTGRRIINQDKFPVELLQLIGARIPNQGHNSMLPMEVVGFIPEIMGDLIIVPSAITKQMGADFDVDKLYTYKRNAKHTFENGLTLWNIDVATPISEMSKEQLQDAYFNVHWGVLMNKDMIEKVLRPLDKPDLEEENKKLSRPAATTSYYHVMNQLRDFQSGKEAKMLVGSTSLSVTFNSVIQNKNLHLYKKEIRYTEDGQPYQVEERVFINVLDEHTGKVLALGDLSGNGISHYTSKDGAETDITTARTKHDNLTTMQSAAVDNAKNRTLDNINLTRNTYRAAAAFIQLQTQDGKAVNLKYVTRLMTQPIIKEFDRRMKTGNDSLSEEFTQGLRDRIILDLKGEYQGRISDKYDKIERIHDAVNSVMFDPQLLSKLQTMEHNDDYYIGQIAALTLFEKLDGVGKRLAELQSLANQDTNGAGPNLLSSLQKAEKANNIDQPPIANAMDIFQNPNGALTEQGSIFNSTINVANNVLAQLLPYNTLLPMFEQFQFMTGRENLTVDQQREIIRGLRSFVYTSGKQWWSDAQADRIRLFYGEQSLAKRIIDAKRTWGKDNYFLQRLDGAIGNSKDSPDYVEYQAVSTGRIDEEQNNRGWLSMLVSNSEEERRLGEDLIRYAYLTGGIQDANSFVKYIPISYIAGTDFGEMLKERVKNLTNKGDNIGLSNVPFIYQYFQHNPEMAMQMSKETIDGLMAMDNPNPDPNVDYPETFRVPVMESPEYSEMGMDRFLKSDPDDMTFVPFISYRSKAEGKWILYGKQSVNGDTYYIRMDTLGNQYTDEYDGLAEGGIRSIFTENRSLAISLGQNANWGLDSWVTDIYNKIYQYNFTAFKLDPAAIGIRAGGKEMINQTLQELKANESLPQQLRTMASLLLDSQKSDELFAEMYPLLQRADKTKDPNNPTMDDTYSQRVQLSYGTDTKKGNFGTSYITGLVNINVSNHTDSVQLAETYLHELLHQRLQNVMHLFGDSIEASYVITDTMLKYPDEAYMAKRNQLRKDIEQFHKDHPQIREHINALERIRAEATNEYIKQYGFSPSDITKRRAEGLEVTTEQFTVAYSLQNIHELTSVIMTNRSAAEWYNRLDSPRKGNLLQRIWQALTEMFQSLTGIKAREGSMLQEAIYHTVSLMDVTSKARYTDITSALVNGTDLRTDTEREAKNIRDIGEQNYGRDVTIFPDETGFGLHFAAFNNNQPPSNPQIDKVLSRLQDQLQEAGRDISKATTQEERVKSAIRYRQLMDDIGEVRRSQDLQKVAEVGNRQLKWVDKILASQGASATQVYAAIGAANIWTGIIDLMYGDQTNLGSIDPEFVTLQAEAQRRRIQLVNDKARDVVIDTLNGRVQFEPEDFTSNIEEIHVAEANLITLSRVKPILAQSIAVLGRQAANNRDEEIFRMAKKLDALKAEMKKNNVTGDMLLEPGHWALATRLSPKWHEANSSAMNTLQKTIKDADHAKGISEIARKERKVRAWEKYWKEMKQIAVFVDTRVLFDFSDGTLRTDPAAIKAAAQLATDVGSTQYASELIDKAQILYQDYLAERDIAWDYFDSSITLDPSEIMSLTQAEQDQLLDDKKKKAYENWLSYNSPNEFLGRMNGKSGRNNSGDKWVVKAPKASKANDFYSQRFQDIQNDPTLKSIYEKYRAIITEMVGYLPATEKEKLSEDFLPIVSTDLVTSLSDIVAKVRDWDNTLMNTFAATEAEEYARIRPNEIPIMYTHMSKRMANGEVEQAKDILRVAEVFSMMALHYKHMAPVLDQINVAESVIKEVNRQRVNKETSGKPLEQLQKSITYFKDALIFKKPRALEGKMDSAIYSMNPAKQIKASNEVRELGKRKKEIEAELEKQWNLGNFQNVDLELELEEVNGKLDEYAAMAHNIYGSKTTDFLISVNQLKALGYNPFSAISNFTFGLISTFIHASSRVDYDQKTIRKAMGIMMNSVQKYYTFGAMDNPEARKILALMDRLGVIGEVVDTQIGGSNLRDRAKGWKSALAPFNWQKSGDFFTKGMVMVAMLLKKQVDVVENGEAKTIPLWEALNEEGAWDETRFGIRPEWRSEEASEQTEWNNYRDRLRKVGTLVFGNQDKNAPLLARKNWLFRLAGQFRMSWLPEGVATRWMDERFDVELGRAVKGRWKTYVDLGLFTSGGLIVKQLLAQLPGMKVDPFNGVVDKKGDPISELDIENMRKNFSGLAFTIAFLTAIMMIRSIYDDDKRRGKKKAAAAMQRQLLINMLIRNHQDLMLYASPSVLDTVTGNLLPATGVVTDAWKAMKATTHYLLGDTSKEKDPFDKWIMKVSRALPVANIYPKTKYMIKRDLDGLSK